MAEGILLTSVFSIERINITLEQENKNIQFQ